jgi:hypothetical protein
LARDEMVDAAAAAAEISPAAAVVDVGTRWGVGCRRAERVRAGDADDDDESAHAWRDVGAAFCDRGRAGDGPDDDDVHKFAPVMRPPKAGDDADVPNFFCALPLREIFPPLPPDFFPAAAAVRLAEDERGGEPHAAAAAAVVGAVVGRKFRRVGDTPEAKAAAAVGDKVRCGENLPGEIFGPAAPTTAVARSAARRRSRSLTLAFSKSTSASADMRASGKEKKSRNGEEEKKKMKRKETRKGTKEKYHQI